MSAAIRNAGSPIGSRMIINGREVDYFCGTSYYTLHGNPLVIEAASVAMRHYGIGPATSLSMVPFDEVVDLATSFFEQETIAYVASGYLGMMVLTQALRDDYDLIFIDELAHYSILDAVTGSGKEIIRFRHLDPDDLAQKLHRHVSPRQVPVVITDGVFPVTGAIAPLPDYAHALAKYGRALLCVDDSHALGVIGERGQGTFEYYRMKSEGVGLYFTGTLSKAFGGFGGIIPGNMSLAEKIRKNVRVPLGASRPPIPAAAAAAMGIRILREHPEMRRDLWRNVHQVREGLHNLGFSIEDTPIPIVNVKGSPAADLKHVQQELDEENILVVHVPPHSYSDAPDVESLRIAVFSTHSQEQIDRLLAAIGRAI